LSLEKAKALLDAGELDEALAIGEDLLKQNPEDPLALFLNGQCLMRANRTGMAFNLFARSAELEPRAETYNAMGFCLNQEHQIKAAEGMFKKALSLKPDYALAMNNLCSMKVFVSEPEEAMIWGRKAIAAKPGWTDPLYNMSLAHLMQGNWKEGWRGYELGLGRDTARGLKRNYNNDGGPDDWDGAPGKSVVIYGEQGIGDEIMFASMLPDAIKDCKRVILDCDSRLESLFRRSFPSLTIYGTRFKKEISWPLQEKFDAKCAIGSLGQFYRNKDEDFPGKPYLVADPERRIQWRALLDSLPGKKKVGIAWTGGTPFNFEKRRSLKLEDLLPILKTPDIDFVSLQYKDPTIEIAEFQAKHGIKIHHWARASESKNYDDVAALVAELDCIVSVCTSAVHLSGALGIKAHVLTPSRPMWRYQLKGKDMPFYSCHQLHRQMGTDWNTAIESVQKAIVHD